MKRLTKSMTETTEQELKEKLLKFAGFTFTEVRSRGNLNLMPHVKRLWKNNLGVACMLPDFTHSLDDCIEFLGPKFEAWEIKYIGYHNGIPKYRATVEYYSEEYIAYSEFPARAFCRAVEKLIDAGDK